jgi:Na+-driven multidrug efflux pump
MNLKTIFKRLILLNLLLIILVIVSLFFESEEVARFNENLDQNLDQISYMMFIIVVIWMLVSLINLFLLYKFKSIGKQIYLILFIVLVILNLILPPHATDSLLYVLDGLGWANSGAILVFLYFTPIKKEFDK